MTNGRFIASREVRHRERKEPSKERKDEGPSPFHPAVSKIHGATVGKQMLRGGRVELLPRGRNDRTQKGLSFLNLLSAGEEETRRGEKRKATRKKNCIY